MTKISGSRLNPFVYPSISVFSRFWTAQGFLRFHVLSDLQAEIKSHIILKEPGPWTNRYRIPLFASIHSPMHFLVERVLVKKKKQIENQEATHEPLRTNLSFVL